MILYLDASALVKRYVQEPGSAETAQAIAQAEAVGTALISRAETAAALAKAARLGVLSEPDAVTAVQRFRAEWINFIRIQTTDVVVVRADALAWEFGLRGFDAVHLASALLWQEQLDESALFATFDHQLWRAASLSGIRPFPDDLPDLLTQWHT